MKKKIENNARPRQPRRKQPEKKWCTRAPPRPRGCVLRLRPSFAPRPRSLWPAAELRFAAIVCSTLCVVVAARGQHLSSCLPLASRTRWRRRGGTQPARPRGLRLLAAAVALTGLSLAPRLPAPAPGSAAAAPRLRTVPAPVLAGAPYRLTEQLNRVAEQASREHRGRNYTRFHLLYPCVFTIFVPKNGPTLKF